LAGRRRRLVAAVLLLVLGSACQVTTTVGVSTDADGSGVVRVAVGLDASALQRFEQLQARFEVDDLRRAGWDITGPRKESDGRTWIRAAKDFATPAEAGAVVAEVSGKGGPFQGFQVTRHRTLLRTRTNFVGTVDLAGGIERFSDDDLRSRLGGTTTGVDPKELQQQLGDVFERIFQIRVAARLPGKVSSNAPEVTDGGAVWRPKLGERVTLEAAASTWNTSTIALGGGTAFALLLLVLVLVVRLLRRS
jgi:hypothetical protein